MEAIAVPVPPSYMQRLWALRYFLFSLVAMDLRARYKRSLLGVGWSLVRPIAMTCVLCLIFCRLFNMPVRVYAPFLLCGITLWQFIYESAYLGCSCFMQGAAYIRQQPVPLAMFPLRIVLGSGLHASISIGLTLTLITIIRGVPALATFAVVLPSLVLVLVFCWSLSVFFGLLHTYFPDTQHLMEIIFQILFYLTPILYPPEMIRSRQEFAWFIDINPMAYLFDAVRQPLLTDTFPPLHTYVVFASFVVGFTLVALLFLRKMEKNLVFWV